MNKISFFWKFRTVKTMMQKPQIDTSPIEYFSNTKKFLMLTLMVGMEPVVLVKYDFECREILKAKDFHSICRNIRVLLQKKERMTSKLIIRLQVLRFRVRF